MKISNQLSSSRPPVTGVYWEGCDTNTSIKKVWLLSHLCHDGVSQMSQSKKSNKDSFDKDRRGQRRCLKCWVDWGMNPGILGMDTSIYEYVSVAVRMSRFAVIVVVFPGMIQYALTPNELHSFIHKLSRNNTADDVVVGFYWSLSLHVPPNWPRREQMSFS